MKNFPSPSISAVTILKNPPIIHQIYQHHKDWNMLFNDNNDKAINTAASVRRTRWGVTPPVGTATGAETPLNNPNCPSTRVSNKLMTHGDATTAKVTTTTCRKKGYSCI
jgi:hypothetical protein